MLHCPRKPVIRSYHVTWWAASDLFIQISDVGVCQWIYLVLFAAIAGMRSLPSVLLYLYIQYKYMEYPYMQGKHHGYRLKPGCVSIF